MMPPIRRPALELAEIVRRHGHRLGNDLSGEQRRILRAIASCRTAALGGHVQTCGTKNGDGVRFCIRSP